MLPWLWLKHTAILGLAEKAPDGRFLSYRSSQDHSSRTTLDKRLRADPAYSVSSKHNALGTSPTSRVHVHHSQSPPVNNPMRPEGKQAAHLHSSGAAGPTQRRNFKLIMQKLHRSSE